MRSCRLFSVSLPQLQHLDLKDVWDLPEDWLQLPEQLTYLSLGGEPFNGLGAAVGLSSLSRLSNLQHLGLVDDCSRLRLPTELARLTTLCLPSAPIGVLHITRMTALRELELPGRGCAMLLASDACAAAVAQLTMLGVLRDRYGPDIYMH